jgi:hypothetical protein
MVQKSIIQIVIESRASINFFLCILDRNLLLSCMNIVFPSAPCPSCLDTGLAVPVAAVAADADADEGPSRLLSINLCVFACVVVWAQSLLLFTQWPGLGALIFKLASLLLLSSAFTAVLLPVLIYRHARTNGRPAQ